MSLTSLPSPISPQEAEARGAWAMRWHLLVNAPSSSVACNIMTIMDARSTLPPCQSSSEPTFAPRASALLGRHPEPIAAQGLPSFLEQHRARAGALGDELPAPGTYLVELAQIRYKTPSGALGPQRVHIMVIAVERADLTLDVDLWSPGRDMSESDLRLAIGSLVQQRDLDLSLPPGPLLKRPAL